MSKSRHTEAQMIGALKGRGQYQSTAEEVRHAIDVERGERRYYCTDDPNERSDELWLYRIDAAAVLRDIFGELSTNQVRYDKVKHSTDLTRWIVENAPQDLQEVADLLARVLDKKRTQ